MNDTVLGIVAAVAALAVIAAAVVRRRRRPKTQADLKREILAIDLLLRTSTGPTDQLLQDRHKLVEQLRRLEGT